MNVSPMKTTLVCLFIFICWGFYFVYHSPKIGLVQVVAGNVATNTNRADCFLERTHSGIDLLPQRLAGDDQESSETNATKALFYDRLTLKEKVEYRNIIQTFSEGVPPNITYFLYAGALLGSYSHHGMIPWDDDVDIMVREKDKPLLRKFLQSLDPKYEHYTGWENWKLYHKKSPKAGSKSWNWPFLDIFFYFEKSSFIHESKATKKKFKKSDVFPLIRRPFMGMMLPAPRHTRKVLESTYTIDLCVSNSYDHRLETHVPPQCVVKLPCDLLKDKFPFVERQNTDNSSVEVLDTGYSERSVYETTNIY